MFCGKCGSRMDDDARFCGVCGALVSASASTQCAMPNPDESQNDRYARNPYVSGSTIPMPDSVHPAMGSQSCGYAVPGQGYAGAATAPMTSVYVAQEKKRTGLIIACTMLVCILIVIVALVLVLFKPFDTKPVTISDASFPDGNLRQTVSLQVDADGDGILSREEILAINSLSVDNVSDLKGLESFENLKTVDVRSTTNHKLFVPDGTSIEVLTVNDPELTTLEASSMPDLAELDVSNTKVESIEVGGMPNLKKINAIDTSIGSLDVSNNPDLQELDVDDDVDVKGLERTRIREFWLPTSFSYVADGNGAEALVGNVTYNDKGLVTRLTFERAKGSDYTYEYDGSSRVVTMVNNGAYPSRTEISYDSEGRVSGQTTTSSTGNSNLSYTYGDGGLTLVCKGMRGNNVEVNREVNYDRGGRVVSASHSEASLQGSSTWTDYSMEYDASGQLVSCKESGRSRAESVYAVTWNGNQRISKIMKTSGGVREGNEFTFGSNGRLDLVKGLSDFDASAGDFTYNKQGLPTSWVVSSNAGSTPVKVAYKRYLTSDEGYEPQQVVLFGNLYPDINPEFWDPASICTSGSDCIDRLPAMVPNLTNTTK